MPVRTRFYLHSDLDSTAEEVALENVNPWTPSSGMVASWKSTAASWRGTGLMCSSSSVWAATPTLQIRQGKNLLGVSYDVDLTDVVTRIMPPARIRTATSSTCPRSISTAPTSATTRTRNGSIWLSARRRKSPRETSERAKTVLRRAAQRGAGGIRQGLRSAHRDAQGRLYQLRGDRGIP